MGKLLAGVGRAIVTPPVGIEMGAWCMRNGLAQGVHDDHCARALVLDDGKTTLAIASLDVLNVSVQMASAIRGMVAAQTTIPKTNILLNCSHTHTTPYCAQTNTEGLSAGHRAYLAAFPHQVAGAIIAAWHARQPASIGAGSIDVPGVSVNRRDPALPADPEVGVIRVDGADGAPLACVVNFACHATAVGAHYLLWSADFPGYLARAVEEAEPGCAGMFLQGAQGDTQPWDWYFGNPKPLWGDTFEAAERLGKALAGPALGVFQQIAMRPDAEIKIARRSIVLPSRPILWTAAEAEAYLARLEAMTAPIQTDTIPDGCPGCLSAQRFPDVYRLFGARHEATFARNYPAGGLAAELIVARIGDIVLAANPGEPFNELGSQIKAGSPYEHTYVLALTNGSLAYIPTRDAAEAVLRLPLEEFTDPVRHRRHYGATITTEVGPAAGEMLVDETLRLIKEVG